MNMNKKKVVVVALAVSLVAILSLGSLAWFNAKDELTNTFKVADSDDPDTTPDFSVDVVETDDAEDDGKLYEDILPGDVLSKDPTVKNTGSYDMYTRVIVTLSNAREWLTASKKYAIVNNYSNADSQYPILEKLINLNADWKRFDAPVYDETANTLTYVYYYNQVVAKGSAAAPVFTTVTIPSQLQQSDMDYGVGADFTINVKAEAVQSRNMVPDNANLANKNEAYYAFNTTAQWQAGTDYDYPEPTTP